MSEKLSMQAHLSAMNDEIWEVITIGLIKITKVNIVTLPLLIPMFHHRYHAAKTNNLNKIAKEVLFKEINDS